MEAQELMAGDWVKVIAAEDAGILTGSSEKQIDIAGLRLWTEGMIKLKPIPLTEAFLELNGFEYDDNLHCLTLRLPNNPRCDWVNLVTIWRLTNGKYCLSVENNLTNQECNRCQKIVEYVHQLQHALRVCEVDELANNLKIK